MHDLSILNHLRSRLPALLAELKRLVEHESPSHDKPALDALAELLAGRLSELVQPPRSLPTSGEATTSSAGFRAPRRAAPP